MNIRSEKSVRTGPFNLTAAIVFLLLIWLPAEFAWPAVSYDLVTNSNFNTAWNGSDTETLLGRYGPKVGDLNGDGIDDVILPEYQADTQELTNNGAIYIFYGPIAKSTGTVKIASDTFNVRIDGHQSSAYLGMEIWIRDVNEDGVQDIIMREGGNQEGNQNLYFIYGPLPDGTGNIINLAESSDYNLLITPPAGLSDMKFEFGDINNDQKGDILVEAVEAGNNGKTDSGSLYVLYGPPPSGTANQRNLSNPDHFDLRFDGQTAGDKFGHVKLGDLNGDGALDLLMIAPYADLNGMNSGGFYISRGPFPESKGTTIDMSDSENWVVSFGGANKDDKLGLGNRCEIADLNADGYNDIIISADYADTHSLINNGSAYVIYGPFTQTDHPILNMSAHFNVRFDGAVASEYLPDTNNYLPDFFRIADMNDDGDQDLIISAWNSNHVGGTNRGIIYLIYGGADWPSGTGNVKWLNESLNYDVKILPYGNDYERLGISMILEDMDGDGITDMVIGSSGYNRDYPSYNPCYTTIADVGKAHVYYGPTSGTTIDFSAEGYHIRYTGACNRSSEWMAAGDLDGDGIKDILISNHISTMPYSWSGRVYAVSTAKPAPKIISPGLFTKVTDPAVEWTSVSGANTYRIQVDDDPSFGSPLYNEDVVGATSKDLSGLTNGESYYVHVKATDGDFTRYGAVLSFTVDTTAPTAPILVKPGDDTGDHPPVGTQTPEFDWSDSSEE